MKKSELKELIKPIVKECVQESVEEILLESGLLSAVIKEVIKGALPVLTESRAAPVQQQTKQKPPQNNELLEQLKRDREEMASEFKKQNSEVNKTMSMKIGGIDVFKDTKPAPATVQESVANPLGGVSPNDPGVDISKLFGRKKFNVI